MIHRRLFAKGIKYYFILPHNTGHGIHSPYLFRLIHEVFAKDIDTNVLRKIEIYRHNLLINGKKVNILDLGARPNNKKAVKKISNIAERESVSSHYGNLLFNLVSEYKSEVVLELGTSLGIGTLYLALANPKAKIYTIEGSIEKANLASSMLSEVVANVEVITGNFDNKLSEVLKITGKVDLAFIDGNHQKESTLLYFEEILKYSHENTVMVFDDINWSPGMMDAWLEIQQHPKVRVCLDLFRLGIVLINPKLQKENFTIFY